MALGKLYSKLLIFLKRKMGNSAALTFILFVGWISFNCSGTYGLTGDRSMGLKFGLWTEF